MKCPVCKKNILSTALKCPYCHSRTGLFCSVCGTVNPLGSLKCKKCSNELLKVCSHCGSVNFPNAKKCRKCSSPFGKEQNSSELFPGTYSPKLFTRKQALNRLCTEILANEKKIFSISGEKGIGKTHFLSLVKKKLIKENFNWCEGRCTQLTQVTPGGVIKDMLLNLFNLPNFCIKDDDIKKDALSFFSKEFRFLDTSEVSDFFNFLYSSNTGKYEDIIINKKHTFSFLNKIFDAFVSTGKFIFVVDNFDFIDGFSAEFLNNFFQKEIVKKNVKFIAVYNSCRPVNVFFAIDNSESYFFDICLAPLNSKELDSILEQISDSKNYLTDKEKRLISARSLGNGAFVEQAGSYAFDCQIADKVFLVPQNFEELVNERLSTLKKINPEAYKLLCGAAILGDRLNVKLLKEIYSYESPEFDDILIYLVKSHFVKKIDESIYEFSNLLLWETVLKTVSKSNDFSDINAKIGKAISVFTLNTHASMAMIAHNLKENKVAFDIWTKITLLSSYIGDVNLYVIAQKQCLALINELDENETLDIRYNISERLGKILTEYDPEEALEFLPDAISHAKSENNEAQEIDLLSYLAKCCLKTENYNGNIECIDTVLKKLSSGREIEVAMLKASKLPALYSIGNCGEMINLIDNDILPVLSRFLVRPPLTNTIDFGLIFDTWLRVQLFLSRALALQGNDRTFSVISDLFQSIEKHRVSDVKLICALKLTLAFANTIKGKFKDSDNLLDEVDKSYRADVMDEENISEWNLIYVLNRLMQRETESLNEVLFEAASFSHNNGQNQRKNIFKLLLGKVYNELGNVKQALAIYNEQILYFVKEKLATSSLLSWYLISEATIITQKPKGAIDIAQQALEIAKNPKINNYFIIVKLNIILAFSYIELSDYDTARLYLDTGIKIAQKYNMLDLLSQLYLIYGKCYKEVGLTGTSEDKDKYLKIASQMFSKALDLTTQTKNAYVKSEIEKVL